MTTDKKIVFVTGGAGYIGSHTCKALAAAGFYPVTIDNLSKGHEWAVQWGPLERGDILDTEFLQDVFAKYPGAVGLIHFAAFIEVGESMQKPDLYRRNNFDGACNLFFAAEAAGIKNVVFSGTAATYGNVDTMQPITEDLPWQPSSVYGETKVAVELALRGYAQAPVLPAFLAQYPELGPQSLFPTLKSVSLRYFNASGADQQQYIGEAHDPETHLIPLTAMVGLGKKIPSGGGNFRTQDAMKIFGSDYPTHDGTCVRDYIHVSDLAAAHVRALQYLLGGGKTDYFNLGTGRGHSVLEVIKAVETSMVKTIPTRMEDRRAGDPPFLVADPSKANRILGWQANFGLDEIVDTAVRWHREQEALQREALARAIRMRELRSPPCRVA